MMPDTYRGWDVCRNFIGEWEAYHPQFDEGDPAFQLYANAQSLDRLEDEVDRLIEEYHNG